MTEGRSARAQLSTAQTILALGEQQLREHADTGAHADRVDELHQLKRTWTARVAELKPLAREEQRTNGAAFGL